MNRSILKQILSSQAEDLALFSRANQIVRNASFDYTLQSKEIVLINGVRRSGKSYLLEKLYREYPKSIYINFEDPRLANFKAEDFELVYEIWVEENPTNISSLERIVFFDEIQNIPGWEPWMNFFAKQKNFKVFLTGSNANLLSKDLGTHLTGRNIKITIYPLSLDEILRHKSPKINEKILNNSITTETKIFVEQEIHEILNFGAFPQSWLNKDASLLNNYYSDILQRDIVSRHKIKDPLALENLCLHLMSNVGRVINKSKLAKLIGFKDPQTVAKYLRYISEAFLGFELRRFDLSVRKQLRSLSKFYAIDPALAKRIGIPSDSVGGFYLENLVLLELLRKEYRCYYWNIPNETEIDFLAELPGKGRILVQACWSINNTETLARELKGFSLFAETFKNLKTIAKFLITFEQTSPVLAEKIYKETGVQVLTFWEWVLKKEDSN